MPKWKTVAQLHTHTHTYIYIVSKEDELGMILFEKI